MLVVQGYCPQDADQAERAARWLIEMGGCKGHSLLLVEDTRISNSVVSDLYRQSFDSVEILPFVDHWNEWPTAPNMVFSTAARHIEDTMPQPWLFWEPDAIPLKPDWLDLIEAEYKASGKRFLGDFVSVHTPEIDVEDHCSGVAVYPGEMLRYAGTALIAADVAFDVVAAPQILPQMHRSKHISHSWKHQPFHHWSDFEREVLAFKPECCLFHADKAGSLYALLRARQSPSKRLGMAAAHTVKQGNDAHSPAGVASSSSGPLVYEFRQGRLVPV